MAKHEIFCALCSLFNGGEAAVSMNNVKQEVLAKHFGTTPSELFPN